MVNFPIPSAFLPKPCRNQVSTFSHGAAACPRTINWGFMMKKERRWLKSAILAAKSEDVVLPWAARRLGHVAQAVRPDVTPRMPVKFGTAIAAR
jgi:hypothetical protein